MTNPQLSLFDSLDPQPEPDARPAASDIAVGRPAPAVPGGGGPAELPLFAAPAAAGQEQQLSLFEETPEETTAALPEGFEVVDTPERLEALARLLAVSPHFAFDTETTALDPMAAGLVGLSFSMRVGEAFYVPVGHTRGRQLPLEQVLDALRPALVGEGTAKIGHNLKFDVRVLKHAGVAVRGPLWDSMLAAHLVREEGSHGLKECARSYLGREMTSFEGLTGRGRRPIRTLPVHLVARYACDDADATLALWEKLRPELAGMGLEAVFRLESELLPVVARMESDGVTLDPEYLAALAADLERQIGAKADECYAVAGCRINLNSPKQVSTILYERLGLPVSLETATGHSTGESALRALTGKHALPALILEHRELSKLLNGYALALLRSISPVTGRVHPNFQQIGARSGRFSCTQPNLQNLPKDAANTIRRAFAAAPGHLLVSADYSQIELRVLAHYTGDPGLLEAFRDGEDVHARTAAEIFGVSLDAVTREQRGVAKGINFGLVYGMSPQGLAAQLGISTAEAERYVEAYFARYSGVRRYMADTVRQARAEGYATTLLGRRRHAAGLNAPDARVRGQAERQIINAPIQGSAADIIKGAMVRLAPELPHFGARMILQVHDELVVEVPAENADALREVVVSVMEAPPIPGFAVPLRVDVETGTTWH